MKGPAIRSRLHALHAELQSAQLGRNLLDDKREAILRTLGERSRRRATALTRVEEAWEVAQRALHEACLDMGPNAVDAAGLAQEVHVSIAWRPGSVAGVATPRLIESVEAFAAAYGAATTTDSLDRTGAEFTRVIGALVRLAEEDEAVRNLQTALRKTVRRLKGLEQLVIPQLESEARAIAVALEEEERDDAVRARRLLAAASGGQRRAPGLGGSWAPVFRGQPRLGPEPVEPVGHDAEPGRGKPHHRHADERGERQPPGAMHHREH
jgi:H(+)-transporting ATP synthase subunit D